MFNHFFVFCFVRAFGGFCTTEAAINILTTIFASEVLVTLLMLILSGGFGSPVFTLNFYVDTKDSKLDTVFHCSTEGVCH